MIGGSKATFGATSGTRGYIAPERIIGYPADFRSDIFSLGCVAYEIFCGEPAFGTHCAKSVLNAMKGFQPNSLTWNDIPSSLRDMITGMLKVNREKRLTDIEQVRAMIVKILEAQQTRTDGAS